MTNKVTVASIFFLTILYYYSEILFSSGSGIVRTVSIAGVLFASFFAVAGRRFIARRSLWAIILGGVVTVLATLATRNPALMFIYLLAISIKDVDDISIGKMIFWPSLIFFIAVLLLGAAGVIEAGSKPLLLGDGTTLERLNFGFKNPNHVFLYLFPIAISGAIIFERTRWKWIFCLALLASSVGLYVATDSQAGMLAITVFIAVYALGLEMIKKIAGKWMTVLFVIFAIASALLGVLYNNGLVDKKFNDALSGRPAIIGLRFKEEASIKILGNSDIQEGKITLDNFYMFILFKYGLLVLLAYMIIHARSRKKISNTTILFAGAVSLVYGLAEGPYLALPAINIYLIYGAKYALLQGNKKNE